MDQRELFKDNLRDSHWLGEVVDNLDPKSNGRCRVKVFGKFDLLDIEDIPWAVAGNNQLTGSYSPPNIGEIVAVYFDNGDIYTPVYKNSTRINADLKSEVLDNTESPEAVTSIVYDNTKGIKMYHTQEDGMIISTGNGAQDAPAIRLSNDGKIYIYANDVFIASSFSDESEPAVKGQTLADLLNNIVNIVKNHMHVNAGPMTPIEIIELGLIQDTINNIKQKS